MFYENNQSQKISWHCLFKGRCKDNKMSKMLKYAEKIHLIKKSGKKVVETSSGENQMSGFKILRRYNKVSVSLRLVFV
jgi:hypothetical protein